MSLLAYPLAAQYAGRVSQKKAEAPTLRAVAVLEWTAEEGKPQRSRLVPICILDQGRLQDASLYLARPLPLALAGGTEYELQRNGHPFGFFELQRAGQEQGFWVGYGRWKAPVTPKPKQDLTEVARSMPVDDEPESDKPVLVRKPHAEDEKPAAPAASEAGKAPSATAKEAPPPASTPDDPDRPVLRRKSSADEAQASQPAADPDKPTLHRREAEPADTPAEAPKPSPAKAPVNDEDEERPTLRRKAQSEAPAASSPDPDRPTLRKGKPRPADSAAPPPSTSFTDPDRPRLVRGKVEQESAPEVPTLVGLPEGMQQAVAVSDAQSRPEHPWEYVWADPSDAYRMQLALEEIAREALGLTAPPPPAPVKPAPAHGAKSIRKPQPVPPPAAEQPAPLVDVQFRVFELAYGSGATLVYSARTQATLPQQKFVTLIAQPDLYGKPLVLLKSVTDGAHLDAKPMMQLVDAVDALADNRGALLFELRGLTQRQFALYRVQHGQAEAIFTGGGGDFSAGATE